MDNQPPPPSSFGPPYGQPGQPGQPWQPYDQPPKGGGRTIVWVVVGIVVAILLICGGSVVALAVFGGDAVRDAVDEAESELAEAADGEAPSVGECLYFSKDGINDDHTEVACDDPLASHEVVDDDGDCGSNETTYKISYGDADSGNVADLCLVVNASAGDCFDITNQEAKVVCADHRGEPSVVTVVSVGAAGATCEADAQPLEYTDRDLVICFAPNE